MRYSFYVIIFSVSFIAACSLWKKKQTPLNKEDVVVRVYDNYLLKQDIPQINSQNPKEDSLQIINRFINRWSKEQVALHFAKRNISKERSAEILAEVKDYRNELLIHEYEAELVEQKFNNVISLQELKAYYEKYMEAYTIDETLIRFIYIKGNIKDNKDSLKSWLGNDSMLFKVEDYCSEKLLECHLDTVQWVPESYLVQKLNDDNISTSILIGKTTFVPIKKEKSAIYLKIIDKVIEGQTAPYSYVQKDIREVLTNKKKKDFIKEKRDALYQRALNDNQVEIY